MWNPELSELHEKGIRDGCCDGTPIFEVKQKYPRVFWGGALPKRVNLVRG